MGIRYKVISDDTDFDFYIELRPWYTKWLDFKEWAMDRKWNILVIAILAICVWTSTTSIIYRFINPDKTQTQAFLHIPKSFILDFKE